MWIAKVFWKYTNKKEKHVENKSEDNLNNQLMP